MRQRVALARALATEPDVLLMDEPFAALDAQTRDLLHDELERIWAETGRTIIFVTHNVREAARLGDRVAMFTFRPGRIKREFAVDQPRPRQIEDPAISRCAKEILDDLREEINKSLEQEYRVSGMKSVARQVTFYAIADRSMAPGGAAAHLAALPLSIATRSVGIPVGGVCGPQFLDRNRSQHETHSDRICTFSGNRHSAGRGNGQ